MLWDYSFLILSLILWVPAVAIWLGRRDLRRVIYPMALASLPFAATERLFYPDYWSPPFLFDLVNRIGFGLEDILFVVALAAVTTTIYAVVTGKQYGPVEDSEEGRERRPNIVVGAGGLAICFGLVGLFVFLEIPMIYGSCIIMAVIGGAICAMRHDLFWPSLVGLLATTVLYFGICLGFDLILPGVFEEHWHTEDFLDLYLVGVPLEELLYAGAAGFVATCFYPFVTDQRFIS